MTVSIREWIWREHWWKEQLLFLAGKSHMSPTAVCLWGGQWRLFIPGHRSLCFYTSVFLFISCHSALQGGYKHKQSTGTAEVFADVRFRHNWFSVQNLRKYVHSINITCKRAALIQSQCLKAWKTFPETHTAIRTCRLLPPLRNCHEECKRWGRNSISLVFNRSPFLSFFFLYSVSSLSCSGGTLTQRGQFIPTKLSLQSHWQLYEARLWHGSALS